MDLKKVIELFESKHTEALSDQHAARINILVDSVRDRGFDYKDLTEISRLLELCFQSLTHDKDEIEPALLNFLRVLEVPFNKQKSSDETNYVPLLSVYFTSLCPLLRLEGSNSLINYDAICAAVGDLIISMAKSGVTIVRDDV